MRRPLFCVPLCTRSQTVKDLSPGCDFVGVAQRATRLILRESRLQQYGAPTPLLIGEVTRRAGEVNLSVSCADSSPSRRAGPLVTSHEPLATSH